MRVRVYRNLKHGRRARPLYSVVDVSTGRVICWKERVMLTDAVFKVSEAGRQRVLQQQRKNVHAFVIGNLVGPEGAWGTDEQDKRGFPVTVTYNPYTGPSFVTKNQPTNYEVKLARGVLLNEHGISACYVN